MVDDRLLDDRLRHLETTLGVSRSSWPAHGWKFRLDDIVRRIDELERGHQREQRTRTQMVDLLMFLMMMAAGPGLMLLFVLVGR
jgi:hypothetical protein